MRYKIIATAKEDIFFPDGRRQEVKEIESRSIALDTFEDYVLDGTIQEVRMSKRIEGSLIEICNHRKDPDDEINS